MNHSKWVGIFLLLSLLSTNAASSATDVGKSSFGVEVGAIADHLNQRLSAPAGYGSQIASIAGLVRARPSLRLGKHFLFEPSVALALPWRAGTDGSSKLFTFLIDTDLAIPILSFLQFRVGTGIFGGYFYSSATEVDLNNGSNTTTSAFYSPESSSWLFELTVQAGISLRLSGRLSLNLDALATSVASSTRRSIHGTATLGLRL